MLGCGCRVVEEGLPEAGTETKACEAYGDGSVAAASSSQGTLGPASSPSVCLLGSLYSLYALQSQHLPLLSAPHSAGRDWPGSFLLTLPVCNIIDGMAN